MTTFDEDNQPFNPLPLATLLAKDAVAPRPRKGRPVSIPVLTSFERVSTLADRSLQLSSGSVAPTVPVQPGMSAINVAKEELRQRTLPQVIRRFLPDGTYEDFKVSEMMMPLEYYQQMADDMQ